MELQFGRNYMREINIHVLNRKYYDSSENREEKEKEKNGKILKQKNFKACSVVFADGPQMCSTVWPSLEVPCFRRFFQWPVGINTSIDLPILSQLPRTILFTSFFSICIGDMVELCFNEENVMLT